MWLLRTYATRITFCTALTLFLVSCGERAEVMSESRGNLTKSDLSGSCSQMAPDQEACQGKSSGNCWCDENCAGFGDCCADYSAICSIQCSPTGVACVPDCPASGKLDSGAPCTKGNFNQATCTCDPVEEKTCEDAGGKCVAVYPGACNGEVISASCGGIGVQCCKSQEPSKEPKNCGPFMDGQCEGDQICDIQSCAIGATGTCIAKPPLTNCGPLTNCYEPVCGCDGKTYANDAERLHAGMALDYKGACKPKECPATGIACVPECPSSGKLVDGTPCMRGIFNKETCQCDLIKSCKPVCDYIGSNSEGWYDGCNNTLYHWDLCSKCTPECKYVGSNSEGWYSSCTGQLITFAICG